jgi:hypothetical protein
VTISSAGNASDFGDMTTGKGQVCGTAGATRGIIASGYKSPPGNLDVIEKLNIASTGNSTDFGDLSVARTRAGALSSDNGGLQS